MEKKALNKLQSAVIKESAANLAGACKLYAALFSNTADLKAVCKSLNLPVEAAIKVAALAKDRKQLVAVCGQMLPAIDGQFVKLYLYEKRYNNKKEDAEKGVHPEVGELEKKALRGKEFKAFGYSSPIRLEEYKWEVKNTPEYTARYVWGKIKTYNVRLVAKCVSEYISHESKA